jgi:Ca-activated chloride channel family protein
LSDVQITDQPVTNEGVRDKDFEEVGYEILAQARTGPLILQKTDGDRVGYFFLFHTDRSTLPYRVGFPILVSNLVDIALQHAALSETRAVPTGNAPPRVLQPDHSYRVTGPDGFSRDIETSDTGELGAFSTPVVGRYAIWDGQKKVDEIPVSLLQPDETLLTSVESIQFKEMKVEAAANLLKSNRDLWTWFAGFGFCALLVEWWYFQRRPGGVPR